MTSASRHVRLAFGSLGSLAFTWMLACGGSPPPPAAPPLPAQEPQTQAQSPQMQQQQQPQPQALVQPRTGDTITCREGSIGSADNIRISCNVNFVGDAVLRHLEGIQRREKVTLHLTGTPTQEDFATLSRVPWLTELSIEDGVNVRSIETLKALRELRHLVIDKAAGLVDLSPLASVDKLDLLRLNFVGASNVAVLVNLPNLTSIQLHGSAVDDIEPLTRLPKLGFLSITASKVRSIAPLSRMTSLNRLMMGAIGVSDITPLKSLTNLGDLDVHGNPIRDLSPIAELSRIQTLMIHDTEVSDLRPLAKLTNLGTLWASNTKISDVSPVATHARLQTIELKGCRSLSSIAPLATAPLLINLHIQGSNVTSLEPLLKGAKRLRHLSTSAAPTEVARFKSARPGVEVASN